MPLFLAPLLWVTSAGAALAGSAMGYRAHAVWSDAGRICTAADEELEQARAETAGQLERTNRALAGLDELRQRVVAVELGRGLRVFAAVLGVKRGAGPSSAGTAEYTDLSVEDVRSGVSVLDAAKGGGLALVGGAAGAFGAFGLAGVVGTASTGTAIASLSGAAATNASLAYLGGGALSAGGAGMTGGMVALGGAFAGPAIAAAGWAAWAAAEKDRSAAEAYSLKVARAVSSLLAAVDDLRVVEQRAAEVAATTAAAAAAVALLTDRVAEHLTSHGWREDGEVFVAFKDMLPEQQNDIALLGMSLKGLSALLAINVVEEAESLRRSGRRSENNDAHSGEST
ncbi:hypothetical protein J8J14_21080 [Roseomonas sp. SSH11]|uniref:Uncharacterized protein n=1 Tax=Pararoseomonas baculiformis TaxID=2820812 RepID=A0ABS4AJQ4_9PROT|nr:hypothetical protein [Pararoseomonas baculiformis]MBP0447270.1 hypothetical protein [Pararoseomonas baculiformis]